MLEDRLSAKGAPSRCSWLILSEFYLVSCHNFGGSITEVVVLLGSLSSGSAAAGQTAASVAIYILLKLV
jgi:hypothetical protein